VAPGETGALRGGGSVCVRHPRVRQAELTADGAVIIFVGRKKGESVRVCNVCRA
jgi:hypothetical protein